MYQKTVVLRACHACDKKGHLEIVCKSKELNNKEDSNNQKQKRADVKTKNVKSSNHYLEQSENDNESLNNVFYNNNVVDSEMLGNIEPLKVRLKVENKALAFEIDIGSPITAISKRDFDKFKPFGNAIMRKTTRNFRIYTGDLIIPLGTLKVKIGFLE